MVAYEFYRFDELKGCDLVAILPERRKNPQRITEESIMEWVKKLLNDPEDLSNIFWVKVTFSGSDDEKGTEEADSFLGDRGKHERDSVHR